MIAGYHDPSTSAVLGVANRVLGVCGKLPPRINDARQIAATLRSAVLPRPTIAESEDQLVASISTTGRVPADLTAKVAAIDAERKANAAATRVVEAAIREADERHVAAIRESADELLNLLRATQQKVLDEARDLAPVLVGQKLDDPWSGSREVVEAKRRVGQLAAKHADIKLAHRQLRRSILGEPEYDGENFFGEWQNADRVWGSRLATRHQIDWRPEPQGDPVRLLLWEAGTADQYPAAVPEVWLPTGAEQDAVAREWVDSRKTVPAVR